MVLFLVERIGTLNQYIDELAKAYQKQGHKVIFDVQNFLFSSFMPDFIHIHWPEAIYDWRYSLPKTSDSINFIRHRLDLYKVAGVPIVYTAHNILPHKNVDSFDVKAYQLILDFADIVVHHGIKSVSLVGGAPEGNRINLLCPHGPYPLSKVDRDKARTKYGLPSDRIVFLNFGNVRPNKGFAFLRDVFSKWREVKVLLWTVGPRSFAGKSEFYKSARNKLLALSDKVFFSNYKTELRRVPNEEIPGIMTAADVVFLGNQSGLNSGVVSLAATYSKPVVFPQIGNFEEQLNGWPWRYSYEPGNVQSAIDALRSARETVMQIKNGNIRPDNSEWLRANSWEQHVENVIREITKIKSLRTVQ